VTLTDLWNLVYGAVAGIGGIVAFLLVLMIGFCLVFDLTKFRSTINSKTTKSLGAAVPYLPPNAPRGPSDQLAGSVHAVS
jgi:hypothetical protein